MLKMRTGMKLISLLGLGLLAGCDGQTIYIGNLAVTAIPCVLLYLTLNFQKED